MIFTLPGGHAIWYMMFIVARALCNLRQSMQGFRDATTDMKNTVCVSMIRVCLDSWFSLFLCKLQVAHVIGNRHEMENDSILKSQNIKSKLITKPKGTTYKCAFSLFLYVFVNISGSNFRHLAKYLCINKMATPHLNLIDSSGTSFIDRDKSEIHHIHLWDLVTHSWTTLN